ncbi:Cinnamoyl-CoA reductase 1 [Linum perenne]
MSTTKHAVCVTGAGGFLGSWVVRLLLSKEYSVHGTVRDPTDDKYAHLKQLPKASTNLKLVKADLLDYPSLVSAFQGCSGVFHVASPVPAFSVELLEPAVTGTRNVVKACVETQVNRAVVVSSGAAVSMNPNWPKDKPMDESCWSDKEYCKTTENWYCASKTEAESLAFEYGEAHGLDVVSVCPNLILGPILQPTVNASTMVLIKLLKDGLYSVENKHRMIVDVQDVAEALVLVYEKPEAQGRYICTAHSVYPQQMVEILKEKYPNYNFPNKFIETHEKREMSSEKLQRLGWSYRPLEQTLVESVESYKKAGILD